MAPHPAHFFLEFGGAFVRVARQETQGNSMKFTPVIFAAAAAVAIMAAPASADDIEAICTAAVTADGGDASGCGCLAAEAKGDAAMTANIVEIAAMATADRGGHTSEATAAAIEKCFPQAATE